MKTVRILVATVAASVVLGGTSGGGPSVPPGAAALGYTEKVIDERPTAADIAPDNANNGSYKWFTGAWWDGKRPPMSLYGTTDGVLTMRWMELDVNEGGLAKSGGAMSSVISWTGNPNQEGYTSDISNNWATGKALDRTKAHTFGASYDPIKRQVTSWLDGNQEWQTPVNCISVPEIAARQHFYPILSVWRIDKGIHKPYSMHVSGVRAYAPPADSTGEKSR